MAFGKSVKRVEDHRLLTGAGRFTDDLLMPDQAYGLVLRSPYAHATLQWISTTRAAAMPGVLAILTDEDARADGLGDLACSIGLPNRDGSPIQAPARPLLARGKVRYVGEPIAFVVAETAAQARDALEAIEVDYGAQPAVIDASAALAEAAPQLFADVPGNLSLDWETGDARAVDKAIASARHVVRRRLVNNRIVVASMEARGALATYDKATGRLTLHAPSQGVHYLRDRLAETILHLPPERIRVVTEDVGGGFGMKARLDPEHALTAWAAMRLARPVKWTSDRMEAFVSDSQGRDQINDVELALDDAGRFLALKVHSHANLGAYVSDFGPYIPTRGTSSMLSGVYRIPAIYTRVTCALTNTVPVDAYRGAGRPEASYLVERMVDAAAAELGLSQAEIRQRNFIQPEEMPYTTATGLSYDSGNFPKMLSDALERADWQGYPQRRAKSTQAGKLRGIGISCYIESCGGYFDETADLRLEADGSATLLIGSQNNGQGHETTFAQLIADGLGLPMERIRVVQGDSDRIATGNGTGGSCMLSVAGNALQMTIDRIVEKGKQVASLLLEAAEIDIDYRPGSYFIKGTDRDISLAAVAASAHDAGLKEHGLGNGLADRSMYAPAANTYPNGCHIAEIEIDPDTGRVTIPRYTIVDDFGRVLNPMMVLGQIHGGTVQGIGQALTENCHYDAESGQLLSGSLTDYALPRADDMPDFDISFNEFPCTTNPLGVKGAGEAGAIAAPAAIINAILDATRSLGLQTIDMPATPAKLWQALRDAAR